MPILVIGSIATDNILLYEWNLKDSIEKETINWKINTSIKLKSFRTEFWWTGLNLCYNIALLWGSPILSWAIWKEFEFSDFIKENVNLKNIYISELIKTSHSYITKDSYWNNFSVFYPWAIEKSDSLRISDISETFTYAIISPTKKETMFQLLGELQYSGVKIFFDPGQELSNFDKEDLNIIMQKSDFLIVNENEFSLFKKISGLSAEDIISSFEKVVITFSEKGSKILSKTWVIEIPAVKNEDIIDDTWAGEAYRAGLIKWLISWYSWKISAEIWSLLASFSLSSHWWQNHFIEKKQFEMWFADEYKEFIKL